MRILFVILFFFSQDTLSLECNFCDVVERKGNELVNRVKRDARSEANELTRKAYLKYRELRRDYSNMKMDTGLYRIDKYFYMNNSKDLFYNLRDDLGDGYYILRDNVRKTDVYRDIEWQIRSLPNEIKNSMR